MKLRKIFNQAGMGLMEITIGIGLVGMVGLFTTSLLKQTATEKKAIDDSSALFAAAKVLEGRLLGPLGCEAIMGKALEQELGLNPPPAPPGQERAKPVEALVKQMTFKEFLPSNSGSSDGLARIETTLEMDRKTGGPRTPQSEEKNILIKTVDMFVPVTFSGSTVEGCNLSYVETFERIQNEVCRRVFGNLSESIGGCGAVIQEVWRRSSEEICKDLYGAGTSHTMDGHQCNLAFLHGGKTCGALAVSGFNADGTLACDTIRPTPNSINVVTGVAPACTTSSWLPDPSTVCSGVSFQQTSNCAGTRDATGTKTDGRCASFTCSVYYQWRDDQRVGNIGSNGSPSEFDNSQDNDCNNAPGCGIRMGVACTGGNGTSRVKLSYYYAVLASQSPNMETGWTTPDGSVKWGEWSLYLQPGHDKHECKASEGSRCGTYILATAENATCSMTHQIRMDGRQQSNVAGNGELNRLTRGSEDRNCNDGVNPCKMTATLLCNPM